MASERADESHRHRDLVVIGASAGGVEVLRKVVAGLPEDLAAAVCIVLHIAPGSPSALAPILQRAGTLPCRAAEDGAELQEGHILVAPPDRHLVIEDGVAKLTLGPHENGHRPAVDALFRSAARARGGRVIGVILSGTRDDGAAGLAVIKAHGGAAIVQDPKEALYSGMPTNAIAHVLVDAIVPSERIADAVAAMVDGGEPPPEAASQDDPPSDPRGEPVITICPECGGVLSERSVGTMLQWECRVGHRYSPTAWPMRRPRASRRRCGRRYVRSRIASFSSTGWLLRRRPRTGRAPHSRFTSGPRRRATTLSTYALL